MKYQPLLTLKNPLRIPFSTVAYLVFNDGGHKRSNRVIDPIKVDFALAVFLKRCRNQFASIRLAKQIIGLAVRDFSFGTF